MMDYDNYVPTTSIEAAQERLNELAEIQKECFEQILVLESRMSEPRRKSSDAEEEIRWREEDLNLLKVFNGPILDPMIAKFVMAQRIAGNVGKISAHISRRGWLPAAAVLDPADSNRYDGNMTPEEHGIHMTETARWAYANCKGRWDRYLNGWWDFENREDAMLFKLKWVK